MSTPFDDYPAWARSLAHSIRARLGDTFVLHGNTLDLVPVPKAAAAPRDAADFVPVTAFLADWVFGQRDIVIEYQRANGVIFHTRDSHKHFIEAAAVVDAVRGTSFATAVPRDPVMFCALLDAVLKQALNRPEPLGVAVLFPTPRR